MRAHHLITGNCPDVVGLVRKIGKHFAQKSPEEIFTGVAFDPIYFPTIFHQQEGGREMNRTFESEFSFDIAVDVDPSEGR